MAPSEVRSFREVILRKFDFETSNLELMWGLEIKQLKAHKFVWQECFFYLYFLATSTTNWALIFTGVLFYAYVETHQMRRLVFDNYLLKCPLSTVFQSGILSNWHIKLCTNWTTSHYLSLKRKPIQEITSHKSDLYSCYLFGKK